MKHLDPGPLSPRTKSLASQQYNGSWKVEPSSASASARTEPAMQRPFFARHSLWISEWVLFVVLAIGEGFTNFAHPRHRFIPAGDPGITYPLVTETVNAALLICLTIPIPLLIVSIIFIYDYRTHVGDKRMLVKYRYHTIIRLYLLALISNIFFTDLVKKYIGRPRPNFIALAGYSVNAQGVAVFTGSESDVREAFQSFLSGHASLSMCSFLYLSQFFAERFRHSSTRVVEFLCWTPILLAIWIALTRCLDYYHNFDDVLGGASLGACVALFYYPHPGTPSTPFYDYSNLSYADNGRKEDNIQELKEGAADAKHIAIPTDKSTSDKDGGSYNDEPRRRTRADVDSFEDPVQIRVDAPTEFKNNGR